MNRRRKVLGAGLDVLEYEKLSFETLFKRKVNTPSVSVLIKSR
jgi:D-3-phosphoglycerate dehydrogenase